MYVRVCVWEGGGYHKEFCEVFGGVKYRERSSKIFSYRKKRRGHRKKIFVFVCLKFLGLKKGYHEFFLFFDDWEK